MARSHIAAAVAIASLALLITLQLITQFGLPNVGFFHFQHVPEDTATTSDQIPFLPSSPPSAISKDGPQYLLGVGKADITG